MDNPFSELAHESQTLGMVNMQRVVLRWALANKQVLSQPLIDGLIEAIEAALKEHKETA